MGALRKAALCGPAAWLLACAAGCISGTICAEGPAEAAAAVLTWDTHEDFDECYRNRYLDSENEPGSVKLARGIVIADEMGAGYNDYQPVRGKVQAKKILMLDSADLLGATLLVGGAVSGCDILVNGRALNAEPLEKSYWHAEWERYAVPPELLRAGANEFVFRARNGASGSIRIERSQQPNRSAVSRDGGSLWDYDHLGVGGYMNGELQVRLNAVRYAPEAWIESPVLDLAACVKSGGLPAGADCRVEDLVVDADVPRGTRLAAFVRTGATPDGCEENWTRWHAWPRERDEIEFCRFAQWRLVLGTRAAQRTPVVRRVALECVVARALPEDEAPARVRLIEEANQRIVRSSYPFAYGRYGGKLRVLREHWNLAEVTAGIEGEFEQQKALRQWVREQWTNGWEMGALDYVPSWDARVILTLASQNLSLGMCTHYATTYVQCSQALGYTSRSVFRGHAIAETWSNQYGKWIMMDPGGDPNDRRRATSHFERAGVPLSELEVHNACFIENASDDVKIVATNMSEGTDSVEPPIGAEPDAVMKMLCVRPLRAHEFFMPLRNNFLEHREPEEPEHGMGYFKFLGHIYWKDETTPEVPWTDFFTTRAADLYWTLNQAQIFLLAPEPGDTTVEVILDTVTPNFAGYELRVDGGEWTSWNAPSSAAAGAAPGVHPWPMRGDGTGGCIAFDWHLRPGRNILEARTFNEAGIRGITSRVVLHLGEDD